LTTGRRVSHLQQKRQVQHSSDQNNWPGLRRCVEKCDNTNTQNKLLTQKKSNSAVFYCFFFCFFFLGRNNTLLLGYPMQWKPSRHRSSKYLQPHCDPGARTLLLTLLEIRLRIFHAQQSGSPNRFCDCLV